MLTTSQIDHAKLIIESIGLAGTAFAGVVAYRTFRRSEEWKRAEFLALKMKEFLDDHNVQQAMLLIDWGSRKIPLLDSNEPDKRLVLVTRPLQARALLPHTLVNGDKDSDQQSIGSDTMMGFPSPLAEIRDRYDSFLDGLERFAGYVDSNLILATDLRPYLGYWIDELHAPTDDIEDAEWCAVLLTYIHFYRFKGVQRIFADLGKDIAPATDTYKTFLAQVRDRNLASRLEGAIKEADSR